MAEKKSEKKDSKGKWEVKTTKKEIKSYPKVSYKEEKQ